MITVDEMIAQATDQTGFDDFGPDGWQEGLAAVVESATTEGQLNAMGEASISGTIHGHLTNRLAIVQYRKDHPEVADEEIMQPLMVFGHGRTGTTLLSHLLGLDAANRPLLGYEVADPIPPPEAATLYDDPRIAAGLERMAVTDEFMPEMKTIHREEPGRPTECVSILGQDFQSMLYETMWNLPGYSDWYLGRDEVTAYEWHHDVLQVLQSKAHGRWTLKTPHHTICLDEIRRVYPDALLVQTHRDPATSLGSVLNLVTTFTGYGSDADWSEYITPHWTHMWHAFVDRSMSYRADNGDAGFHDIDYAALMDRPLEVMADLYAFAGWDFTTEVESAIGDYLRANPQGKHGRHSYHVTDFGLTVEGVREQFAGYIDRYSITLD